MEFLNEVWTFVLNKLLIQIMIGIIFFGVITMVDQGFDWTRAFMIVLQLVAIWALSVWNRKIARRFDQLVYKDYQDEQP